MSPILHALPNACASLAAFSFTKIAQYNDHRRTLTSFFWRHGKEHRWPMLRQVTPGLALQKFPLFVHHAQAMRTQLHAEGFHLDDGWTGCVICPDSIDVNSTDYLWGTDPVAEQTCEQILSLPTHPLMTLYNAQRLALRIDDLLAQHTKKQ